MSLASPDPSRPFTLRPGRADDALPLSALAIQVFLDTYATEGVRPDLAREAFSGCSREAFAQRLAEPSRSFVVAHAGDGLLGFAEVLLASRPSPVGGVAGAELVRLYVQPRHQRAGVGRALIHHAERLALASGPSRLWLTVWDENVPALAFYDRMGYADAGATTHSFEGRSYGNRVLAKALLS